MASSIKLNNTLKSDSRLVYPDGSTYVPNKGDAGAARGVSSHVLRVVTDAPCVGDDVRSSLGSNNGNSEVDASEFRVESVLRKNRRKLELLNQYHNMGATDDNSDDDNLGGLQRKYAQYLGDGVGVADGDTEFVMRLQEINSRPSTGSTALNSAR